MAELEQVRHDESGTGPVVQRDRGQRRPGGAKVGAHRDHRNVGGDEVGRGHPRPFRGDQHNGLGCLVLEVFHRCAQRCDGRVGDARQADEVPDVAGGDLDRDHRAGRSIEVGARREQSDHPRALGDQRARCGIAPVSELGDRPLDPLLRRRADVGMVVEHPRHGLVGHVGHAGHVVHSGRPRHRRVECSNRPRGIRRAPPSGIPTQPASGSAVVNANRAPWRDPPSHLTRHAVNVHRLLNEDRLRVARSTEPREGGAPCPLTAPTDSSWASTSAR